MPFDEDWLEEEDSIEEGIYSSDERESLIEDDEISAEEEAFMRGWDEALEI
tara:strand:+ start:1525 stop:1677 length:153 start_codon:yes stop_codon:yes gene_type:complete